MTFNKKLLLCGLAAGVTAYMIYQHSKKKKQQQMIAAGGHSNATGSGYPAMTGYPNQAASLPPAAPQQQQSSGHNWGAMAGGAALLAGGAGLAAHSYQSHQQSSQSNPPPGTPALDVPWEALSDWRHIARLLSECVQDQYLYPFYPTFSSIEPIAKRIASQNALVACADAWELPPSLAQDLCKLALFDVIFELDDSASMRSEGTKRRDALAAILRRAADAAGRFDEDGCQVVWMNSSKKYTLRNKEDARLITEECRYDGQATPMGACLKEKILEPLVYSKLGGTFSSRSHSLTKPVLIIIITDGRPTGRSEVGDRIVKEIKEAKKKLSRNVGEDGLSVTISAVGNDSEAQDWLDSIDSNPEVGDLVDVTSAIHQEAKQVKRATGIELTEDLHVLKLLLGGIDSSFDQSDEPPNGKQTRRAKERQRKADSYSSQRNQFQRETEQALAHAQQQQSSIPPYHQHGHEKSNSSASGDYVHYQQQQPHQSAASYPPQGGAPSPYPPSAQSSDSYGSPFPGLGGSGPASMAAAPGTSPSPSPYPPAPSAYPPAGAQASYPAYGAPPAYDGSPYGQSQSRGGADEGFSGGFQMPGVQHHNPNQPSPAVPGQQSPYPPPPGQQQQPGSGPSFGFPDPGAYGGNTNHNAW